MQKGRLMELTGQSKSDSALPSSFITDAINMSLDNPTMWYVWSYANNGRGQPVNLAEEFFKLIGNTKIMVNGKDEIEQRMFDEIAHNYG